jgi:hypothetical protein
VSGRRQAARRAHVAERAPVLRPEERPNRPTGRELYGFRSKFVD